MDLERKADKATQRAVAAVGSALAKWHAVAQEAAESRDYSKERIAMRQVAKLTDALLALH